MNDIVSFLIEAKKNTYAANQSQIKSCRKSSKDSAYKKNNYMYYDSYFGSNNFIGEEILWENGQAIWGLNYSGMAIDKNFDFVFLRQALSKVSAEYPYRGPKTFYDGPYRYECSVNGNFEQFVGVEDIFLKGQHIYHCDFHGGCII